MNLRQVLGDVFAITALAFAGYLCMIQNPYFGWFLFIAVLACGANR